MKRLHVFDLDKTLLINNCSLAFGSFLSNLGLFSFRQKVSGFLGALRLKFLLNTPKEVHEKLFIRLFRGRPISQIIPLIPEFIEDLMGCSLRSSLLNLLMQAKERGETVLLLSNSPDFLVSAIAKKLDIIYWHATEYAHDCLHRFEQIISMMDGPAKAEFARQFAIDNGFSQSQITAYSDSIDDLPLLELAGVKMAVNPDKRLRNIAQNRGWSILDT